MGFFSRLSNGWTIAKTSLQVLNNNKKLIAFPILSGISLVLVIGSFVAALFGFGFFNDVSSNSQSRLLDYGIIFLFYIVNYFIIVFFNTALIHCAKLYFDGEEDITLHQGLSFAFSRIGSIFSWAVFAGTVGAVLKIVQQESGAIGKIITGIIGVVWNIATFFVVPAMVYEKLSPIAAFKRSSAMMKEKWGESIGANFSFGVVQFVLMLAALVVSIILGMLIHPIAGIAFGAICFFLILAVISAAQTIFVCAVYRNITGTLDQHFSQQMIDNLFQHK